MSRNVSEQPATTTTVTDERLRRYWDSHARGYDREMAFMERILFEDGRQWVCSKAIGDVLEVAIGTGRNLPFYPPNVRLTAIEFSPAMLEIARGRAAELGRPVDLGLGDAQALDLPDAAVDTYAHVIGAPPEYPYADGRGYIPTPASVESFHCFIFHFGTHPIFLPIMIT